MPTNNTTPKQLRAVAAVTCARMRGQLNDVEDELDAGETVQPNDLLVLVGLLQTLREQVHQLYVLERGRG